MTYSISDREAELLGILSYVRPEGSEGQRAMIERFITPLGVMKDKRGNYWRYVGPPNKTPTVLWSCHTDTVHRNPHKRVTQSVTANGQGLIFGDGSDVLGADDGAGIWLCRELILAGVPGLYVFHTAEEVGGLGSAWIAKKRAKKLKGIDFAIALDRAGTQDIITHQGGFRCCSEEFSESLSAQLNEHGLSYRSDDGGTLTDTANYVDHIPECTNLSVGYEHAHTDKEHLDRDHLFTLSEALKGLDFSKLVVKRAAGEVEELDYMSGAGWTSDWKTDWKAPKFDRVYTDKIRHFNETSTFGWSEEDKLWSNFTASDHERMVRLIIQHPEATADLLDAYGLSADDLYDHIKGLR